MAGGGACTKSSRSTDLRLFLHPDGVESPALLAACWIRSAGSAVAKKPEQTARVGIDAALEEAGWIVQDADEANLAAGRGVAVREFPLAPGHGFADYVLFVDGKAAGAVEAKKVGVSLTGVEVQAEKYATGLPTSLPAHIRPLPFLYLHPSRPRRTPSRRRSQPR